MDKYRLAGNLLIASFILVLVSSFIFPMEVFEISIREMQVQMLVSNQMQTTASLGLFIIGIITSASGFIIFSRQLSTGKNEGLSYLAAGVFFLGALFGAFDFGQVALDPASHFHTIPPEIDEVAYVWLTTFGLLLYGILFLREGYPAWFGYLTTGLMIVIVALILIFQNDFYIEYLPQIFYLLVMIAGIIIKRR